MVYEKDSGRSGSIEEGITGFTAIPDHDEGTVEVSFSPIKIVRNECGAEPSGMCSIATVSETRILPLVDAGDSQFLRMLISHISLNLSSFVFRELLASSYSTVTLRHQRYATNTNVNVAYTANHAAKSL